METETQELLRDLNQIDLAITRGLIECDRTHEARWALRTAIALYSEGLRRGDTSSAVEARDFVEQLKRQYQ